MAGSSPRLWPLIRFSPAVALLVSLPLMTSSRLFFYDYLNNSYGMRLHPLLSKGIIIALRTRIWGESCKWPETRKCPLLANKMFIYNDMLPFLMSSSQYSYRAHLDGHHGEELGQVDGSRPVLVHLQMHSKRHCSPDMYT
jgi:hypothetical protein